MRLRLEMAEEEEEWVEGCAEVEGGVGDGLAVACPGGGGRGVYFGAFSLQGHGGDGKP